MVVALLDDSQIERLGSYHPGAFPCWFAQLPSIVEQCRRRWRLSVGATFIPGGDASWAAPVTRHDGSPAVLKVSLPDPAEAAAVAALRRFDGRGAVRVYEHAPDLRATLLEHADPGTMAAESSPRQADEIAAVVLPQLWSLTSEPPAGAPRLADVVRSRAAMVLDRATRAGSDPLLLAGAELLAELAAVDAHTQVLHGDFNQRNVLLSGRGWLAIDPRPMIGEPAYELAQWLVTRSVEEFDPVAHAVSLAEQVHLPPTRVLRWLTAQTIQLCSWLHHSDNAADLPTYETVARRLLAGI